jgi:5-methylcytosine-specific restriction protein B
MAQPFESRIDGYSQNLSSSEIAAGTFGLNMNFFERLKKLFEESKTISAKVDGDVSIQIKLDKASMSLIGGEPLRTLFQRWKFHQGSTLDFNLSNDGKVSINPTAINAAICDQKFSIQTDIKIMRSAINLILYGPPGTGKTYATAAKAVEICDGSAKLSTDRTELMRRYENLRKEGRISFVTFHQSYGYEEFVEGLRPHVSATGQVGYSVRPGVFRVACDAARLRQLLKPGLTGQPLKDRAIWKMSLGFSRSDEGAKVFQYCLKNQCILLGYGDELDFSECNDAAEIQSYILSEAPNTEKISSHVKFVDSYKNELKVGDLVIIPNGNSAFRAIAEVTGDYEFVENAPFHQMRAVKWLAVFETGKDVAEILEKKFTMRTLYRLNASSLKHDNLSKLLSAEAKEPPLQPHVLIIDEINRANISKVFGELITLLEPDKREGETNAIALKLPYSGEDFTVPANLHLIGTMNTADRSIALLDTALRRRFEFEEIAPDPSTLSGVVIEGVDLQKLLTALNDRIEVLFDRDHRIGHAFFMCVSSLEGLEQVFRRKVIPLLQEYFYENWSNVRRALNDYGAGDFVISKKLAQLPADEEESFSDEPRIVYSVNAAAFPVLAYQRIYSGY